MRIAKTTRSVIMAYANNVQASSIEKSVQNKNASPDLVMPKLPDTPADTVSFITQCENTCKLASRYIERHGKKSVPGAHALKFARHVSGMSLDRCAEIADEVRSVGPTKGSGEAVKKARKKKDEIMKSNGFQKNKLWRNICELDKDCVAKAKQKAIDDDDFPTINSALRIKRENKSIKPRLAIYDCHGIFSDTVLPNNIKFDKTWNATSLFCNVGLGTYMLKDLNINIAVVNDLVKIRTDIHKALYDNDSQVITGDITDSKKYEQIVDAHKKSNCRIILMSPSCQSFSKAGTQNLDRKDAKLVLTCMKFLTDTRDYNDIFMCENVPEFLGAGINEIKDAGCNNIYEYIKQTSDRLGYITNIDYLDAACYGTGEKRNRSIIMGIKKELVQKILGTTEITADNVWKFPKPDEFKLSEEVCLLGIPSIEAGEHRMDVNRLHYALDLEPEIIDALQNMSAGQTSKVKICSAKKGEEKIEIKRAHGDRPAPTITGESSHFRAPSHCFPAGRCRTDDTQSDARYRTPYEILVLMGMPRDFELPEKIKIQDGDTIWCKKGPVSESEFDRTTDDIVVSDEAFRTMLGEHFCPTVVKRCFEQLIYQIQNKDF